MNMDYTSSVKDVPINSTRGQIGKIWKDFGSKGAKKRRALPTGDPNEYEESDASHSKIPGGHSHEGLSNKSLRSPRVEVIAMTLPGRDSSNPRASMTLPPSAPRETQSHSVDRSTVNNDQQSMNGVGGLQNSLTMADLREEVTRLRQERNAANTDCESLRQELNTANHRYEELNTDYRTLNGDLDKKTREMRLFRKDHEEQAVKWQRRTEIEQRLQRNIDDLQSQLQARETQLLSVERERDKFRPFEVAFHDLDSRAQVTREELDVCVTQLKQIQELYNEIQKKYEAASNELSRIKLESRSMLDDAFFQRKWKDLQAEIGQWANTYFWVAQKRMLRVLYPHDQENVDIELSKLSEDCKDLLNSEGSLGRSMVAEAYLWRFIEEEVWNGNPSSYCKGFYWAHNLRSEFCRIEKFLRPAAERPDADQRVFYKWKASTAELLLKRLKPLEEDSRVPVDPEILNFLIRRILNILRPWLTGDEGSCGRDLCRIFQSAIDFDSQMNEQFSSMYAAPTPYETKVRHGFAFDSLGMEAASKDIQMADGQPVGIVVSPALIRLGTANGDLYDKFWILAKSRVGPQRFAASSQRPKNSSKGIGMITGSVQRQLNS